MLQRLNDIIKASGRRMLTGSEFTVSEKDGRANYVTDVDLAIQRKLISDLKMLYPEAGFIAEENGESGMDRYKNRGSFFIIDPIDGTTNFIHGCDCSVTSVALVIDGSTVYGCVYNPFSDEMFCAERGKGAFLNGIRITASGRDIAEAIIGLGLSTNDLDDEYDSFYIAKRLLASCHDLHRSGSAAYDMCRVADGRLDGFFQLSLYPWDYAAAALIIAEAGGECTNYEGKPLFMDRTSSVIAGSREASCSLRKLVSEARGAVVSGNGKK